MKTWILGTLAAMLMIVGLTACAGDGSDDLDAYLLADELRQSSDDLTRMARLYSVTGEERYKTYFQRILDIRNGASPRPSIPYEAYWDITLATGQMPDAGGETKALRDMLRDAGLTGAQMDLVAQVESNSNALAELEDMAFSASTPEQLETARAMLHGQEYHNRKMQIMWPMNQLLRSLMPGG